MVKRRFHHSLMCSEMSSMSRWGMNSVFVRNACDCFRRSAFVSLLLLCHAEPERSVIPSDATARFRLHKRVTSLRVFTLYIKTIFLINVVFVEQTALYRAIICGSRFMDRSFAEGLT